MFHQHFALSNLHSVTEFSVLQSTCPESNLCFLRLPTALFWTGVYLLSQGPTAIKACNCHPKSIVSCCLLKSWCHFATLPSCDSSAFQLLMSLLLFVFSAEAKYTNCSVDNGGCEHFCRDDPANQRRSCSCASGYQLMNDHTMCKPVGKRRMFVVQIWRRIIQTWHKRVLWENCLPCTLYWFSKHPFHAE